MNISPTQRRINFEGIEIIKIAGGQIVERWGEWNGIEIMQQLGMFEHGNGQ
jgi:predicted ester cyclase